MVFAYGNFLDKVVRFLAIAVTLWVVAVGYSRGTDDSKFLFLGVGWLGWRD